MIDYSLQEDSEPQSLLEMLGFGQESNLRYCWIKRGNQDDPDHVSKWYALGEHESKKTVEHSSFIKDVNSHPNSHAYFSPNEFFSWRNTKQVSLLHSNFLDIDTVDHKILTDEQENTLINEVFEQLIESGVPWPSALVKSGSGGIHLYWAYSPVPAYKYNVAAWKEVTEKLASSLKGGDLWSVDLSASLDVSRVLRLPGSIHPKSGRTVTEQIISPDLYHFSNLLKSFDLVHLQNKKVTKLHTTKATPEVTERRRSVGKHNIKTWWANTFFHIVSKGRKEGFSEGQRDHAAFMLFVALRHIKGCPDKAFEEVKTLNDEFIHLSNSELSTYLKTALTTQYKYRKDTLSCYLKNNLGVNPSYLYSSQPVRLSPVERNKRQSDGAKNAANIKRVNTSNRLKAMYIKLKSSGKRPTQTTIASSCNLSVRTVRRYWSEVVNYSGVIRLASI